MYFAAHILSYVLGPVFFILYTNSEGHFRDLICYVAVPAFIIHFFSLVYCFLFAKSKKRLVERFYLLSIIISIRTFLVFLLLGVPCVAVLELLYLYQYISTNFSSYTTYLIFYVQIVFIYTKTVKYVVTCEG